MDRLPELFGSKVFSDSVMQKRLPHDTYKAFKRTLAEGHALTRELADIVASSMKDWAIEHGATPVSYTHLDGKRIRRPRGLGHTQQRQGQHGQQP